MQKTSIAEKDEGVWRDSPTTPDPRRRAAPTLPSCGTGPLGRLRFVARDLQELWRQWRQGGTPR